LQFAVLQISIYCQRRLTVVK